MSVAYDIGYDIGYDSACDCPGHHLGQADHPAAGPARLATVTALYRPGESSSAPPMRLTRRGVAVVAVAVAVLAAAVIGLAWLSAPPSASAPVPAGHVAAQVAARVAVLPGDSLWSIATRVAPNRDPRAEVALLQELNHLEGSALVPGQVLRTR